MRGMREWNEVWRQQQTWSHMRILGSPKQFTVCPWIKLNRFYVVRNVHEASSHRMCPTQNHTGLRTSLQNQTFPGPAETLRRIKDSLCTWTQEQSNIQVQQVQTGLAPPQTDSPASPTGSKVRDNCFSCSGSHRRMRSHASKGPVAPPRSHTEIKTSAFCRKFD